MLNAVKHLHTVHPRFFAALRKTAVTFRVASYKVGETTDGAHRIP
jgi:hypothetical protein